MSATSRRWFVYLVRAASGKLYAGITTDVERRFREHVTRNGGAKFFRSSPAEAVVYVESCESRSAALKREAAIRRLSRSEKLSLGRDPRAK